jgi:hypothetical protein
MAALVSSTDILKRNRNPPAEEPVPLSGSWNNWYGLNSGYSIVIIRMFHMNDINVAIFEC